MERSKLQIASQMSVSTPCLTNPHSCGNSPRHVLSYTQLMTSYIVKGLYHTVKPLYSGHSKAATSLLQPPTSGHL